MALGMKYWFGIVAAGLALVAVWSLPPAPLESHWAVELSYEEARSRALSAELRRAHFTLQRRRWVDSLAAAVVAGGTDEVALLFPTGSQLVAEAVTGTQARISAAEATLEGRRSDVALGFVYQYLDHAAHPGVRIGSRSTRETYVGIRDGVDYCFRVHAVSRRNLEQAVLDDMRVQSSWRIDHLGPCLLYGRYGAPGSDIVRWLESGGIDFALGQTEPYLVVNYRLIQPLDHRFSRRGVFGVSYFNGSEEPIYTRCIAGVAEACARVFLTPGQVSEVVASRQEIARQAGVLSTGGRQSFSGQGPFILADLEREFGAEKFQRFWTSDAPVDQAFEAAFGIEAGTWMVHWLETFMVVQEPGPGLPQSSSSGGLLTIALFAGIAFLRNRRRNVL